MERYKDKDFLDHWYIKRKKSSYEIGRICNVHGVTIQKQLHKFGIKVRNTSEALLASYKKDHVEVTDKVRDFIIGNLLGDGGIFTQPHNVKSIRNATYQHSCKHRKMLEFISDKMSEFGFEQCGNIREYKHKKQGNIFYCYQTKFYEELLSFRRYMYRHKIKFIPEDIILSPTTCLYWYLGDGNLAKERIVRLHTCGFTYEDNEILVRKLNNIDINSKISVSKYNILVLDKNNSNKFLQYMGNCPNELLDTYGYKFGY